MDLLIFLLILKQFSLGEDTPQINLGIYEVNFVLFHQRLCKKVQQLRLFDLSWMRHQYAFVLRILYEIYNGRVICRSGVGWE